MRKILWLLEKLKQYEIQKSGDVESATLAKTLLQAVTSKMRIACAEYGVYTENKLFNFTHLRLWPVINLMDENSNAIESSFRVSL